MTELQTLKDFGFCNNYDCCIEEHEKELRQEAIMWIKEDFKLVKNAETHRMLERWKNRFNITEEDLK